MSTFSCPVVRVASVENHPNADRLSIVKLEGLGYTCISAKLADGSPRYAVGDLVVYVPSASVLPEWLLRRMDFWNEELGKGTLAGSNGDRVKPMRLRGVFSDGVLVPVKQAVHVVGRQINRPNVVEGPTSPERDATQFIVAVGDDASSFLGITKYEPPIPVHLAGEVTNLFDHTIKYDFERLESVPDMFAPGELVVATEKLHGCLHADSLVMLPNGEQVTIATVVAGEYSHVLSYDIENNEYISRKITGRMQRPNREGKKWVKLVMENGHTLILTEDHPVYSRDRQSWINACDIHTDEDIESPIM